MKNITLKDIAKEVNITVNSVSRALNDSNEISEATKIKVREVAAKLGYIKNDVASSLRNGKTNVIAVVFDNMINPYFSIMTELLQKEFNSIKYNIMIFTSLDKYLSYNTLCSIIARKVDGIITFIELDDFACELVDKKNIPLILLGRKSKNLAIDTFTTNDFKGGYLACEYLINKGCTNIGYLGAKFDIECSKRRLKGFQQCLIDYNYDIDEENFLFVELGKKVSELELLRLTSLDGIFCYNDMLGYELYFYGLYHTEICGFDNLQEYLFTSKVFSSISNDKILIVSEVCNRMMEKINNKTSVKSIQYEYDVWLEEK